MAQKQENQEIKAKWNLEADWDKDSNAIIIVVNEEISSKKWRVELGKEAYNNPREAYDKIRPVIDGGNMQIIDGMPKQGKNLKVKINKGYESYQWELAEFF